jgi:hypothetical protein
MKNINYVWYLVENVLYKYADNGYDSSRKSLTIWEMLQYIKAFKNCN